MNWRQLVVEDLKNYEFFKKAIVNNEERLQIAEHNLTNLKGVKYDYNPTSTDTSHQEDVLINNIVIKEQLRVTNKYNIFYTEWIEKGLKELNEIEMKVLDRFYINPCKNCVDRLVKELNYEKSKIYQLREIALKKFTRCMYGISTQ